MMKPGILFLIAALLPFQALAKDVETKSAVQSVQKEMKRPGFSKEAAKDSAEAKKMVDQINALAGSPENADAIFALAAEVFGNMQNENPEQMMKILSEAQNNPEAFASKWTPEQKRKLKELADRLPASRKTQP